MTPLQVLDLLAVAVCAVSGVLAAEGKRVDLFGVLVLALATAFGGGTVRDVLLGDFPVAWIRDPVYLLTASVVAVATFVVARYRPLPRGVLLVADACGLALFTLTGVKKGLAAGVALPVAVMLGVVTGVAGGILRDVLTGTIPMVFRREIYLYATASLCGAAVYAGLSRLGPSGPLATGLGLAVILALRFAAIRWRVSLPEFRARRDRHQAV